MNVLFVGKHPPIEGGVSAQSYWFARELAEHGHDVDVITNAREVERDYRMFMRPEDWEQTIRPVTSGTLEIHWTQAEDGRHRFVPQNNPIISKLVSLGLQVAAAKKPDIIFSFYLEPYAVAGHVLSRELGIPHVVKSAGSDVGRLWRSAELTAFYDRIFAHASAIWTSSKVREELVTRLGVAAERIQVGHRFVVPETLFRPAGPMLDLASLVEAVCAMEGWGAECCLGTPRENLQYLGIYGKIAENKGIFDLLEALGKLRRPDVGLLVMGGGRARQVADFRERVLRMGLQDRVVQVPFLPHWRVPEFLRRCFAVCCLEREFEIAAHKPVIAREVMMCGRPLIGSSEILAKLPLPERLVSGHNCVAVPNVRDHLRLADAIAAVVEAPQAAEALGTRAAEYAKFVQAGRKNTRALERLFDRALNRSATRRPVTAGLPEVPPSLQVARLIWVTRRSDADVPEELIPPLRELEIELRMLAGAGDEQAAQHHDLLAACLFLAEQDAQNSTSGSLTVNESLHRIRTTVMLDQARSDGLHPFALGTLSVLKLSHDANAILSTIHSRELPSFLEKKENYLVLQRGLRPRRPRILVLDDRAGAVLTGIADEARAQQRVYGEPSTPPDAAALKALLDAGLIGFGEKSDQPTIAAHG